MLDKILEGDTFKSELEEFTLGEFFYKYAEKYAEKICQIDAAADVSETYFSVRQRSVRVAIQLKKMGICSRDIVATCSHNNLDTAIVVIAATYLGAKIANLEPTLSVRNTKHLLSLMNPRLIFVEDYAISLILSSLNDTNINTDIVVLGKSGQFTQFEDLVRPDPEEDDFRPTKVNIHDTAILFFSSGTTGLPKAICHSHYSFLQLTEVATKSYVPEEVILHFTTFYWISGMWILTCTFLAGGTRVFGREVEGNATFKMIEKYKLTAIFMAPIFTYQLTRVKNPEKYDISSLRVCLTGGTSIKPQQLKRLQKIFQNAHVSFGYGMTEIGIISIFNAEHNQLMKTKIGSCGKIAPLVRFKVVNQDTEEVLGPNQNGEIRVKSSALMQGYYNMDSSSCFDPNGFLKSGDLGHYDEEGCIYIEGRLKEMFKYQSWHIVPSSIEAVLHEHPAVEESVVFGIPLGEEGEIPAACVVLKDFKNIDKEEIQKFVEERVSDKEKLRGGITFVERLPRTSTGKLIRAEVRNAIIASM